jgi:hypothetical protein
VAIGQSDQALRIMDRRRVELVEAADAHWARQPYHAAETLDPKQARQVVKRGIESAHRLALREVQAAVQRARAADHQIAGCAVLAGEPMPDWSVDEILAVHFRMHKAEGVLFQDALGRAAGACGLKRVLVPAKTLTAYAARTLATPPEDLARQIAVLGKSVGPPWGKDQKEAALAAMIALQGGDIGPRPYEFA